MGRKARVVISCFYDSLTPGTLPIGFSWADTLVTMFRKKYKVTILLHGECIKFGLNSEVYQTKNPWADFLCQLHEQHVKIVICELCLKNDGFNDSQLLPFVKPIKFSIDYIIESQLKGKFVVYDAQLPSTNS